MVVRGLRLFTVAVVIRARAFQADCVLGQGVLRRLRSLPRYWLRLLGCLLSIRTANWINHIGS